MTLEQFRNNISNYLVHGDWEESNILVSGVTFDKREEWFDILEETVKSYSKEAKFQVLDSSITSGKLEEIMQDNSDILKFWVAYVDTNNSLDYLECLCAEGEYNGISLPEYTIILILTPTLSGIDTNVAESCITYDFDLSD